MSMQAPRDATGSDYRPVVFVHGLTGEKQNFAAYEDVLCDEGYPDTKLSGIDFVQVGSTHDEMADQLDPFVDDVLAATGSEAVDILAHSLGVTGVRYWMMDRDRYSDVETFVGLGGANHGSALADDCKACRETARTASMLTGAYFFGLDLGQLYERYCRDDFLTRESARDGPLADLNTPDETPGDVTYYTLRATDDQFFPTNNESPKLDGATNAVIEGDHYDLLGSPAALETVTEWLTEN